MRFALILSLLLIPGTASAQIEWTGAVSTDWFDPLNWFPQEVPDTDTELASISLAGLIMVPGHNEVGGLSITSAGTTLGIQSGFFFHNYGEELINHGTILVNENLGTGIASLRVWVDTEVEGNGQVVLQRLFPGDATVTTGNGSTLTQGIGHSIRGTGTVIAQMENFGEIVADMPGEELRVFDFDQTNHGAYLATNDAILRLDTFILDQLGAAEVRAEQGGRTVLRGMIVNGGSIVTDDTGVIEIPSIAATTVTGVTHQGTVEFMGGAQLQVEGDALVNHGEMTLDVNESMINTRLRFVSATLLTGDGSVELRNNSTLILEPVEGVTHDANHTLRGEGWIEGLLINEGRVALGREVGGTNQPGKLNITGGFSQGTGGRLDLDVAGPGLDDFDRMVANGSVMLGGSLTVSLNGYTPVAGDSFDLVQATSIVDVFDSVELPPALGGLGFELTYTSTTVRLEVVTADVFQRGDCNGSGLFDISDVIWFLGHLFPTAGVGPNPLDCLDACDANDDGGIDVSDAIEQLNALFGTPTLSLPAPFGTCGIDPTSDPLTCDATPCP